MRIDVRALGLIGLIALPLLATRATAQVPRGHVEPVGFDFRQDGAWRKQVRAVMANRRAALARGDLRFLNSSSSFAAVTGDYKLPIVFVQFSDTTASAAFQQDTAAYGRLFYGANPAADGKAYSVKTYYEEISRHNITIDGSMFGWITPPAQYTKLYVGQNCHGVGIPTSCTFSAAAHFGGWLKAELDSLNSVAHQVDWNLYDSDHDGYVDFVTFIHPTIGGECTGLSTVRDVWAHRWALSALTGSAYVTKSPWTGHAGQFVRIDDYIIQSSRGGTSGCNAALMMPMATMAHETGHAFGLPDLYDTQGSGEGSGEWSLMGSGNYTRPYSPAAYDAWSLVQLGWVKVDSLTASRSVTLNPIQTSDTVLVATLAGSDQYLLLENRAFRLSDTAQMASTRPVSGFAGGLRKQPGLLVWQIDQSIVNGGLAANTVNAGPVEGVRLVQADGFDNLHAGTNRGDVGDSYPGSTGNRKLTYHSTPAMITNEGTVAGFVIDSIFMPDSTGPVSFRFRRSAPSHITTNAVAAGGQITVNGVLTTLYEDIFSLGDTLALSVADTQLVNAGRSQLAFTSWSDAGARVHNIISDGTPDSVTATLTARHRVNFAANGNGTIGTSGPANNTFVNQGSAVTLTATPNGGNAFTNWTGDTTSNSATLILPMGRPYSVTANFTGAVAVSYNQATDAILGLTPLTSQQATYLDQLGNNNATYDLGDYLAYLKANGIVLAPGLLQRVTGVQHLAPMKGH